VKANTRSEQIFSPFSGKIEEFECQTVDFKNDMRIPVLIVYVTCNYSFEVFGGQIKEKGSSVLLLRRGFNVAAMPGLWSVVAGVDDVIDERLMELERQQLRVLDEIRTEAGISDESVIYTSLIGRRDQPNPSNPKQIFEQSLFWVEVEPMKRVSLDYEHTGAIFVPISVIREYLDTGATEDKELLVILKDGVTPDFLDGMRILVNNFRTLP
jgi:hypothetical protein